MGYCIQGIAIETRSRHHPPLHPAGPRLGSTRAGAGVISSHVVGAWWFHLIPRLQGDFFLGRATLGSVNGGGGGGARTVHFGARSFFFNAGSVPCSLGLLHPPVSRRSGSMRRWRTPRGASWESPCRCAVVFLMTHHYGRI